MRLEKEVVETTTIDDFSSAVLSFFCRIIRRDGGNFFRPTLQALTNNTRHESKKEGLSGVVVFFQLHTKLFFPNISKHQTPIRYEFHSPYQTHIEREIPQK